MELKKTIENRRSIRKFKSDDIDNSIIIDLINSARLAPSARNLQPWRFYIARGSTKQKISDTMKQYHKSHPENTMGMYTTSLAIDEAPVLLLVFRNPETTSDRNDTLSLGAGIEHILLSATEIGLGSLWICAMYNVRHEISKIINTPLELYSMIALGYPNENPAPRPRKTLNELIIGIDE